MNDHVKRLAKLARAYAAAEEAIVSAFFAKPRKKSDHLRWLRARKLSRNIPPSNPFLPPWPSFIRKWTMK